MPVETKIYIGDLPREVVEADLEEAFSYFGQISSIWVARNPPGFAFVEFKDPRDAKDAVIAMQGKKIGGSLVKVEHSSGKKRTQPRPLLPNTTNTKGETCYTLKGDTKFTGQNDFADRSYKSSRRSKSSRSSSSRSREACYYCKHHDCRCSPYSGGHHHRGSRRYSSRSSHSSCHSRRHRSRTRSIDYDSDCGCSRRNRAKICRYCRRYSRSRTRSYTRSKSRSRSESWDHHRDHRSNSRHYSRSPSSSSKRSYGDRRSKRSWSRSLSSERHSPSKESQEKKKT